MKNKVINQAPKQNSNQEFNKRILDVVTTTRTEQFPKDLTLNQQIIHKDENYTCFLPTQQQVKEWALKMNNTMGVSYLPIFKNNRGVFLFICKKDEFDKPLNASFIQASDGPHHSDKEQISWLLKEAIWENKKIFSKLILTECYSNGGAMYGQPKIYQLKTIKGKHIQTPEEREKLYKFYNEVVKKTGFNGSTWLKDFDDVMKKYYAKKSKQAQSKNIPSQEKELIK